MKYIGLILGLACALGTVSQAQTSSYAANTPTVSTPDLDSTQPAVTIRKRVDEVNVLFIAMDRHGKFVRDLNQKDFNILDDFKPPQSIIKFSQQTDLPLRIGLLIDTSGSVHGRFQFEQDAATGFLQHVIRPHFDRAFVKIGRASCRERVCLYV